MNLEDLKDVLGDERFAVLATYVTDLTGQRDAARKESIEGRKSLKAKVAEQDAALAKVMEKLGVETLEDIDTLPPAKGQAEAVKQLETRLKRMETDLKARETALGELSSKYRDSQLSAALGNALSAHEFNDREVVEAFVRGHIAWDNEQPLYKTSDGSLLPLDEGVGLLAKTKPLLLKAAGTGGSGYNPNAGSGQAKSFKDMTLDEKGQLFKTNPDEYRKLAGK